MGRPITDQRFPHDRMAAGNSARCRRQGHRRESRGRTKAVWPFGGELEYEVDGLSYTLSTQMRMAQ